MAVERALSEKSLIDVLDRVLDKGIVIDPFVRALLVGLDLVTAKARIVVASIHTYPRYSEAVRQSVSAGAALGSDPFSKSLTNNDDDGGGGGGSSGAPAMVHAEIEPRRLMPSRPRRMRWFR